MNYNVPTYYQIQLSKKSTVRTLNGYPRQEVYDGLLSSLKDESVIGSLYWSAELLASGFYQVLYDCLLQSYFEYINYLSPGLISYLNQKYQLINEIKKQYTGQLDKLGNNQELRNHFTQMVVVLCLSPRMDLSQDETTPLALDPETRDKGQKIIKLLAPSIASNSTLYGQFLGFIMNFYMGNLELCRTYIAWFLEDQEHTISSFTEYKVPPTLSKRSMWLIWQFLIRNLRSKKIQHEIELKILVEFYVLAYKRKSISTCAQILYLILIMARCADSVAWDLNLDKYVNDPLTLKSCAETNLIYRDLQHSYEKMISGSKIQSKTPSVASKKSKTTKAKSKSKLQQSRNRFFENPKTKIFLDNINDINILLDYKNHQVPKSDYSDPPTDDHILSIPIKSKGITSIESDEDSSDAP